GPVAQHQGAALGIYECQTHYGPAYDHWVPHASVKRGEYSLSASDASPSDCGEHNGSHICRRTTRESEGSSLRRSHLDVRSTPLLPAIASLGVHCLGHLKDTEGFTLIAVIDYKAGNLTSVVKALRYLLAEKKTAP